jgi:hypothetical protein
LYLEKSTTKASLPTILDGEHHVSNDFSRFEFWCKGSIGQVLTNEYHIVSEKQNMVRFRQGDRVLVIKGVHKDETAIIHRTNRRRHWLLIEPHLTTGYALGRDCVLLSHAPRRVGLVEEVWNGLGEPLPVEMAPIPQVVFSENEDEDEPDLEVAEPIDEDQPAVEPEEERVGEEPSEPEVVPQVQHEVAEEVVEEAVEEVVDEHVEDEVAADVAADVVVSSTVEPFIAESVTTNQDEGSEDTGTDETSDEVSNGEPVNNQNPILDVAVPVVLTNFGSNNTSNFLLDMLCESISVGEQVETDADPNVLLATMEDWKQRLGERLLHYRYPNGVPDGGHE